MIAVADVARDVLLALSVRDPSYALPLAAAYVVLCVEQCGDQLG